MLHLCRYFYDTTDYKLPWLKSVHSLLNNLGLSYIWLNPSSNVMSLNRFKNIIKQRLQDQFVQRWREELNEKPVCLNYRLYKDSFTCEKYIISLPDKFRHSLLKFRTTNHRLPIQKLRQFGVNRERRVCTLCNSQDIGDEFHYLFDCRYKPLCEKRKKLLPRYYQHHINVLKYKSLMNITSKTKLIKLCKLIFYIMSICK